MIDIEKDTKDSIKYISEQNSRSYIWYQMTHISYQLAHIKFQ